MSSRNIDIVSGPYYPLAFSVIDRSVGEPDCYGVCSFYPKMLIRTELDQVTVYARDLASGRRFMRLTFGFWCRKDSSFAARVRGEYLGMRIDEDEIGPGRPFRFKWTGQDESFPPGKRVELALTMEAEPRSFFRRPESCLTLVAMFEPSALRAYLSGQLPATPSLNVAVPIASH